MPIKFGPGKCPKCEANCHNVNADYGVTSTSNTIPELHELAVAFLCPSCDTVLGVQFDPYVKADELIERLAARLREQRPDDAL